ELKNLADVPFQFVVEGCRGDDGRITLRPQTTVTGLEQIQGQLLLARKVFVQCRIGVAALLRDVANTGRGEPSLTEQFHRCAEDLGLGRGIVLANVEGKHLTVLKVSIS